MVSDTSQSNEESTEDDDGEDSEFSSCMRVNEGGVNIAETGTCKTDVSAESSLSRPVSVLSWDPAQTTGVVLGSKSLLEEVNTSVKLLVLDDKGS